MLPYQSHTYMPSAFSTWQYNVPMIGNFHSTWIVICIAVFYVVLGILSSYHQQIGHWNYDKKISYKYDKYFFVFYVKFVLDISVTSTIHIYMF